MSKEGRGFGYFGDDVDKLKEGQAKKQYEKNLKVQEQMLVADASGKIVFNNIPIGQYEIEVKGNEEFNGMLKSYNIVNEEDKDEIIIYAGIFPKLDLDTKFNFVQQT